MKTIPSVRAFSLTELLLGIAVVAIVAAVIVPKFLSIQSQANATVAQQMAAELNNTYGSWKAAGGVLTGPTANAGPVILSLLGGYNDVGSQPVSVSGGSATTGGVVTVSDPVGNATLIRATLPASTTIDLSNPTDVIPAGDFTIVYDSGSDAFQVLPTNLQTLAWNWGVPETNYVSEGVDDNYLLFGEGWAFADENGDIMIQVQGPPPSTIPVGQTSTSYAYSSNFPTASGGYLCLKVKNLGPWKNINGTQFYAIQSTRGTYGF